MDVKTPRGFGYSRTNSRYSGKSSSLQDLSNRRPTVVTENIAKAKSLTVSSSMGNKHVCQKPSRSASVEHQKPLSSRANQLLPQKSSVVERTNVAVKINDPKCSHVQFEIPEAKTMPKALRFHKLPSSIENTDATTRQQDRKQLRTKPGFGTLHAPTFSFTQRQISSRDCKKGIAKCSQAAGAETKICNLKNSSSSIAKVIPSVSAQSPSVRTGRGAMAATKSFLASSNRKIADTRVSTSTSSNDSRMIKKSKVNDSCAMLKPLEHSRRGTERGLQARRNPCPSPSDSVVAVASFSRSLDNDSCSGWKNFSRHRTSDRPTSSPGHYSTNAVAYSLYYHDQHRDLRMNIDDMSYEELLELQEKMGSVSTGLTDEALTKCLKISKFKLATFPFGIADFFDGNGCSICQEECDDGDEIGTLACEHWYHVVCIQQWLRMKNWCPICKAPASVGSQVMVA